MGELITTILRTPENPDGLQDASRFERRAGAVDNDNEYTTWVEYWLGETLVHRSAHVTLKEAGVTAAALAGVMSNG